MTKYKNILLVTDSLGAGGAQNQLTLLAVGLQSRGYRVIVFTYFSHDFFKYRLSEAHVRHIYIRKKSNSGVEVVSALRSAIKREKIEAVISYLDTPNFYAAIASRGLSRLIFIASHRSMTILSKLGVMEKWRKRWVNRVADQIVCNSYHENLTWASVTTEPNKITTIYNGIDASEILRKRDYTFRGKILLVGKLRPMKNVDVVMRMLDKYPNISYTFDWYGGTHFETSRQRAYAQQIMTRSESLVFRGKWNWKGETPQIKSIYNEYDLLLHPSLVEGLPNVICEAMLAGLPVIASNILDHPRLLGDDTDLLHDPNDHDELYEKISALLDLTDDAREEIGNKLRITATDKLSIDRMIDEYEQLIN